MATVLSASLTLVSLPGLDGLERIAGFVAIPCPAASVVSSVIALFRYKAHAKRAVVYMGGEGLVMLSVRPPYPTHRPALNETKKRRSIVMSLLLAFLAWGIVVFITAITLYSFRGFMVTSPGMIRQPFTDYTHWTVAGAMSVFAGTLIISSHAPLAARSRYTAVRVFTSL